MYARILKFLTNLLFKQVFRGFLTPRKKRKPSKMNLCGICKHGFMAFNKRQKICKRVDCRKTFRSRQYRDRVDFAASQRKEEAKTSALRDPPNLESEE